MRALRIIFKLEKGLDISLKINIGKIIKSYIKDRIKIVGLVCVFAVIPIAVSALYLESVAPAVYSLILYALILVSAGGVDF